MYESIIVFVFSKSNHKVLGQKQNQTNQPKTLRHIDNLIPMYDRRELIHF